MIKLTNILSELRINNPNDKDWIIDDDSYKSFYQLVKSCEHWDVEWSEREVGGEWDQDFYFFQTVFDNTDEENLTPERCIFTIESLENIMDDWNASESGGRMFLTQLNNHSSAGPKNYKIQKR